MCLSTQTDESFQVINCIGTNNQTHSNQEQVIKLIWHKAASSPHTAGSVVFARWRQCAPHLMRFLGPIRVHNPSNISVGSAIFVGLTTVTDWSIDRPTDHATPSVTTGLKSTQLSQLHKHTKTNCSNLWYNNFHVKGVWGNALLIGKGMATAVSVADGPSMYMWQNIWCWLALMVMLCWRILHTSYTAV